jgi:hypothetical protein
VAEPRRLALEDWFYIYRWSVSPAHLSSVWNENHYAAIGEKPTVKGAYLLEPRWEMDYTALTRAYTFALRHMPLPGEIKGTWKITRLERAGKREARRHLTMVIGAGDLEWSEKGPRLFGANGKGAFTVNHRTLPASLELRVGDEVYRGIWRIYGATNEKKEILQMMIGEAGGNFPEAFPDAGLPKDFRGLMLLAERKKK